MSWVLVEKGFERCLVELEGWRTPSKQRPRWDPRRKSMYTPSETRMAEECIKAAWRQQVGYRRATHEGPIWAHVAVQRPLPPKVRKRDEGKPDLSTPDGDNTLKLVFDALNELAYRDDRFIFKIEFEKMPRVPAGEPLRIFIRLDYYDSKEERFL